jgi:cephalosporin hydroxylase
MKFPFDYMIYQMIMHEVQPDLVIEIGTLHGGSALYFADLMAVMGINGKVHTIDIAPELSDGSIREPKTELPEFIINHPMIEYFDQGYQGYDVKNVEGFKTILVIDDGSHRYHEVLEALEKFSPLVTPGSYYIVEDSNAEEVCSPDVWVTLDGGPLKAIMEFLGKGGQEHFFIDLHKCDLFGVNSTYNTYGYLRRI